MSEEQWLREALAEAVPTPPAGGDRGPAARAAAARTRRTRTRLAVAGVSAAVIAAVAVPTLWPGGDRATPGPTVASGSSSPSSASSSSSAAAVGLSCPPPRPEPRPDGPDTVADGAVAARLCPVGGIGWQAPPDPLTTGLGELVDTVQGLERDTTREGQEMCNADLGRSFAVVLGYPDGTSRTLTGELFGCHLLRVGGARFTPADRVWDTYLRLLREQRAASPTPTPAAPADLSCDTSIDSGPGVGVLGGPADLTSAAYCWRTETLTEQHWSSAPLSSDQLARLTGALVDPANRVGAGTDPCGGRLGTQAELVGYDAWGDRIAVDGQCDVFYVGTHLVRLPDGVRAMLDRLRHDRPSHLAAPGAGAAPDVVVEGWADLLNVGQPADADALWVDPAAAPERDGQVQLKVEGSTALDPAADPATSAYASAQRVTALFRVPPPGHTWVDYHEYAFTLVRRSPSSPWLVLAARDLGAVPTGR